MDKMVNDKDFYNGKRVFVTGHTGFKGSWLCRILIGWGAEVTGYSLAPPTQPNLFSMAAIEGHMTSVIGDIRDFENLKKVFDEARPEIVFHLAAQPIVRDSYKSPRFTYETNVMGTVNLMECVRLTKAKVMSVVNITTDKVYQNNEWVWGYRENELLDGFDPYSNSKSCSELVTHCYKNSFFEGEERPRVSTARAGNVIGGGDFANDRIIPDCVRSMMQGKVIEVRNPNSIRPYQHVLEPLFAYIFIAHAQWENMNFSDWYNVGPDETDCVTTGQLVDIFCHAWGTDASWEDCSKEGALHEANFLKLDCSKIKNKLGWRPVWNINDAVGKTVEWTRVLTAEENIPAEMDRQIALYEEKKHENSICNRG